VTRCSERLVSSDDTGARRLKRRSPAITWVALGKPVGRGGLPAQRGSRSPYKYPREIEFVESLPKTRSGKIRRVELRKLEEERAATL
jgi:acyl-CoA synthetase (AMP-forming)/AMP-acid ligase II